MKRLRFEELKHDLSSALVALGPEAKGAEACPLARHDIVNLMVDVEEKQDAGIRQ
jgi:hypothetical protein